MFRSLRITEDSIFIGQSDGTTKYRKEINMTQIKKVVPEWLQSKVLDMYLSASRDSRADDDAAVASLELQSRGPDGNNWDPDSSCFEPSEHARWLLEETSRRQKAVDKIAPCLCDEVGKLAENQQE
jgi:hypothetical protein